MDKKTNHNLGEDMCNTKLTDYRYRANKEFLKISKKKTNKSAKVGKDTTYISEKKKQDWSINTWQDAHLQ